MKKCAALVCALMLLCCRSVAEEFVPEMFAASPLQYAMARLGVTEELAVVAGSCVPEPLCDDVEILLAEVGVSDVLLYGGAMVRPTNPNKTLLMPGNQFWDEDTPYQDGRNWVQIAADEGKTLYAVYVYPVALDAAPLYALDSWALYGGAMVILGYGEKDAVMPDTLDLAVQIYSVDEDGKFTQVVNTTVSLDIAGNMAEESAASPA